MSQVGDRGARRTATLSRTGLEGLVGFDDGRGNVSTFTHDDFALELILPQAGSASLLRLTLASAQDTDSRRNCSLMAAGCAPDGRVGSFLYRCAREVQVIVEYSLSAAQDFVQKRLHACMLLAHTQRGSRAQGLVIRRPT